MTVDARVSLKQLRYFAALARTRHFRKAAETEAVTQPSLSAQLANLEQALQLRLIERGRGPVVLTASGREIAARAQRVLDEVRDLEDHAVGLRGGEGGILRLGASLTIGPYLLPRVVRGLCRDFPQVGLHIREGAPRDLEDGLAAGQHDAVLTQLPLRGADLVVAPIFQEPLYLVLPVDHALAHRHEIDKGDLAGLSLLTLGRRYALNGLVNALCLDTGATPLENYEGTSLDGIRQMVGMGMGAALLPALYVRLEVVDHDMSVVVVPFRNRRITQTIGLAWRRSSGHVATIPILLRAMRRTARDDFGNVLTLL